MAAARCAPAAAPAASAAPRPAGAPARSPPPCCSSPSPSPVPAPRRASHVACATGRTLESGLYIPDPLWDVPEIRAAAGAPGAAAGASYDRPRRRSQPPDLPSLLLDARIVYLGMPLVPAVTELIMAELFWLQAQSRDKPAIMYINSTGTTRADGETVGFETEGFAIHDTMKFVANPVYTVGVGVAIGQACMLLASGEKGKRYMLPHATAMLQQPRLPPTGARQAVEVEIRWREVNAQRANMLRILHRATGHSYAKLDEDLQRPLYMQPADAIEYGVIDKVIDPQGEEVGGLAGKVTDWANQ